MNILGLLIALAIFSLGIEGVNVATGGELYLASVKHLAQETTVQPEVLRTPEQMPVVEEQPYNGDFVDPQEVKNVLREIKDLKLQIKTGLAKFKKIPKSEADVQKLTEINAELDKIKLALNNPNADSSELRIALQEFYDGRFWDEIDSIRFKLEFPREVKDINKTLKRLEKTITTKSVRALGLNLDRVQASIAEMKNILQTAQNYFDNGDMEEAREEMQNFHEDNSPWDIEGTVFRIRDIKKMIKRVKDQTIRAEIEGVLQEVVDTFNNGEYRDARETLDEYADDLMQLLDKLIRSNAKRADDESFSRIQNLEQLIIQKLQEPESTGGSSAEIEKQ